MKKLLTILLLFPMVSYADRFEHHHRNNYYTIPLGIAAGAIIYNSIQYQQDLEYQRQLETQQHIEYEQHRAYREHLNDCQTYLNYRQDEEYDYYCR